MMEQYLPLIIVIAYFALTILIGVFSKKTNNAAGFEGFKLSLIMCVAVGAGEWMGGTSTTGVSEYGYSYGISGAWYTIANGIGICFLAIFFARLFRRLNTATVPEIIGKYLGGKSRIVSSVLLTIVLMIVGVSQMIAIGTLGQSLLHLSPIMAICILGFGVLIYTVIGGMNAIGSTNVIHLIVMYGGVILALVLCATKFGSLSDKLPADYFSPVSIGMPKVSSWIIASVLGACTAQAGLQPILKSKDEKTAVKSSFLIAAIVAPFGILTALLGMYAKAQFPDLADAKMAMPTLLMNMSPVVSGLVLAAILAAVLSTASPIFLSCGTLITRDLYCTLSKSDRAKDEKRLLVVSRTATFLVGAVCILMAVLLNGSSTVLDIVYFAYSLRGSLFVVLLLGIFWKKMNQKAAISAMVATILVGFFWVIYKKITGAYPIAFLTETYAAVLTALIVGVIATLLTKHGKKSSKTQENNMRKTIVENVYEHAKNTPEKLAAVTPEASLGYAELFEHVRGYAAYLGANGVKKGNIVVLKASQTIDYPVVYLAIHLAGGIVTSLENNISDEGMLKVVQKINADIVLSDNSAFFERNDVKVIARGDVLALAKEYFRAEGPLSFPDLEDSADILFTTGTTGDSKGVELSHKALVATAENLIFGCEYKPDTVMIVPGPLNHANAIRKLFTSLVNGSTVYILNGMINMKAFFNALDTAEGTIACCLPPAAIRAIFQLTKEKLGEYKEKIDFIESATSPLPEPDKLKLCTLLPNTRLYNNYGSSEAASVCMYDYNKNPGKDGCIGKAMPNSRIFIVDDGREEMQSSKENMGLIACEGDVNMKGYVGEPMLTKEVLIDGVVYTNDIGYIDEEGFIYISGRQGDVINVGGLKVAPSEVESAALGFEGIEDCICIAVEDRITGNALKLLVVLEKGVELDRKLIMMHLSHTLEKYKIPRFYEQVDKIERTYNGKLNRKFYRK